MLSPPVSYCVIIIVFISHFLLIFDFQRASLMIRRSSKGGRRKSSVPSSNTYIQAFISQIENHLHTFDWDEKAIDYSSWGRRKGRNRANTDPERGEPLDRPSTKSKRKGSYVSKKKSHRKLEDSPMSVILHSPLLQEEKKRSTLIIRTASAPQSPKECDRCSVQVYLLNQFIFLLLFLLGGTVVFLGCFVSIFFFISQNEKF